MILSFLQSIIDALGSILTSIISILPKSPFVGIYTLTIDSQFLSFLAWIVPYQQIIALLEAWGTAIAFFYIYMIILRWVKAID